MGEDRVDSAAKPRYPNLERRKKIRIKGQGRVSVMRGNGPNQASGGPTSDPTSLEPIRSGHHRVWAASAVQRVGTGWWRGSVLGGRRK